MNTKIGLLSICKFLVDYCQCVAMMLMNWQYRRQQYSTCYQWRYTTIYNTNILYMDSISRM